MIVLLLILISLIIFVAVILTTNYPKRLYNFFLVTIFICNIIPDISGIRISEGLPLINVQKIFNAILLIALILIPSQNRKKFDKSIFVLLIVFIAARFISAFYSINFSISILYFLNAVLTIYLYYFAAIRLIDSVPKMNKVIKVIFLTGIIVAFSNLFEFITAINAAHLFPNVSTELQFWVYDRGGMARIFGLKADPVVTAYYLTFIFPLGLYLFHIEKKKKWLYFTIIIAVASILNFTRTSMIAIAVMLFIYLLKINPKRIIKLAVPIILTLLIVATDNPVKQLFTSTLSLTNTNKIQGFDYTRTFDLFYAAPAMIAQIPFWGIGTGSLVRPDLMASYYNNVGYLYSTSSIRTELPFFITTLIDSGFIASISFLFLLIVIIIKSFSLAKESKYSETHIESYLFLIFIGFFICLTFNGIFDLFNIIYIIIGLLNFVITTKKILL